MPRLNKRFVDSVIATENTAVYWDGELKGLGLRVLPSGRKTYFVKCRSGTRQHKVTIGPHGPITPELARTKALEILFNAKSDPQFSKTLEKRKRSITMKELGQKFLDEHVDQHCKASTARDYQQCITKLVNPKLGNLSVSEVERSDIAAFHHDLRDTPYRANRALAILSKMFNLADIWGYRQDGSNPCRHIKKYKEEKRERFLSEKELCRLGRVLENEQTTSPFVVAAIQLLILTGARLNEILTLKWEYYDQENVLLRLPDSKTGAKLIYLSSAAADILTAIPQLEGNPYVICGQRKSSCLVNLQKPWREIRKKAQLEDVRLHDLRHSYASVAASNGLSLPMIGKLLGHTQTQTTARYAHLAPNPLREAADFVATSLKRSLSGQNTSVVDRSSK